MIKMGGSMIEPLSAQEKKVLQMIVDGRTSKEIRLHFKISDNRYRQILSSSYSKLLVDNKTDSVIKAIRLGVVSVNTCYALSGTR